MACWIFAVCAAGLATAADKRPLLLAEHALLCVQMGTKLLGTDLKIASRLVFKTLRGKRLSR